MSDQGAPLFPKLLPHTPGSTIISALTPGFTDGQGSTSNRDSKNAGGIYIPTHHLNGSSFEANKTTNIIADEQSIAQSPLTGPNADYADASSQAHPKDIQRFRVLDQTKTTVRRDQQHDAEEGTFRSQGTTMLPGYGKKSTTGPQSPSR